jgi:large subunit ribosomal protein L27e
MPPKATTPSKPEGAQKFLKPGKVVLVLQGKYAGKKAVIVRNIDESKNRKYGHALLAGIARYPRKVSKTMDKRKIALKSRIKPFVKLVNYNHMMPTRYGLDIDFKSIVTPQTLQEPSKKSAAKRKVKSLFEKRYLSGKNKWFFTKLRF